MKTLLILSLLLLSASTCDLSSIPKPTSSTNDCSEGNYRHKSVDEIAAMTPTQLIDESVKEQIYHESGSWNQQAHDDGYGLLIDEHINRVL